MKTLINCIIILILFSGCENKLRNKNQKFEYNYFENGELKSYISDKEEKFGVEVLFNDNHHLELVGHFANNRPLGYVSYYYKNQQIGLRQYITIDDEAYINQYWGFDECGNIDRNFSNFFSISASSDTVSVNQEWEIEIKLDCPYYKKNMNVVFGDYNENYELRDSSSLETVEGKNFEVKHKFLFPSKGIKIVRGYIDNYELLDIKEGDVCAKSRMNFFKKEVVVVD